MPVFLALILALSLSVPVLATEDLGDDAALEETVLDEGADYSDDNADAAVEETEGETTLEETDAAGETTSEETTSSTDSDQAQEETTKKASSDSGEQIWPEAPEINAGALYLLETNTNSVLNEKNADQQMYPASTTKILTCLIALETCSLDDVITFSETAVDLEEGDSNIGAVAGEQMALRDVLYGLMLPSGNECANAIAEYIGGSVDGFADIMNEKAEELGCTHSHFSNPSGLYDTNHYTSAHDLALIAQAAGNNSTFLDIISHSSYTIEPTNMDANPKVLSTTNELIDTSNSNYTDYVIGGKTGYLSEAGRCLVSFAKKDGMTLVSVLLNAGYEDVFPETIKNFEYGFNNFTIKNVSENETRFSYMDEKSKVYLDTKSEILMPNNVAFDELTVGIEFVSDMDEETRTELFNEIGMSVDSSLRLYARLNYSYADHKLGNVNVLLNPDKELVTASFVNVKYINPILIIIVAIIILIITIFASRRKRRRR